MRLVAGDQECVSCASNTRADLPARERIYLGPRWRVAHPSGTSLPGWLVLVPRRHTVALDDLTADEAADLGDHCSEPSAPRCGIGGIRSARRTRRIVDAPTRWPSLSSSPWIRWYPQP
jgi:hypothetical protein